MILSGLFKVYVIKFLSDLVGRIMRIFIVFNIELNAPVAATEELLKNVKKFIARIEKSNILVYQIQVRIDSYLRIL